MIELPEGALILLIGASGAGKSTFAAQHFRATEVISSDQLRGAVADTVDDQAATADAFRVLHLLVELRLARGRMTVVDATNLLPIYRAPLIAIASGQRRPVVAIVLDLPLETCLGRNRARLGRTVPPSLIGRQVRELHRWSGSLGAEGVSTIWTFVSPEQVDAAGTRRRSEGGERP